MDYEYILMYQQAEKGLNMFNNMLDRPKHPIASVIKLELRRLMDDVRSKKRPRSIENRIHDIQRYLMQARQANYVIMRIEENIDLHQHLGRLKEDLRKLHNY